MTPTQRTLKALRDKGCICGIVEKFNPHVGPYGRRFDLFGIIDIIALDPERGVVGVQSTGTDFAGHYRKLTEEKRQESLDWLTIGRAPLELWGWRKVKKKRGGKAMVYRPRIHVFTTDDFK